MFDFVMSSVFIKQNISAWTYHINLLQAFTWFLNRLLEWPLYNFGQFEPERLTINLLVFSASCLVLPLMKGTRWKTMDKTLLVPNTNI